ncbi:MAG: flagellar M-ring protein FliF [Gemmatimonadetes bacterium]|nr:flagellar M-ring protein FliF [Gemmatimonadota bacterium]
MSTPLDTALGRIGGPRQLAIIAVGVLVTAAVFGVSRWATEPTWVPLAANQPLETVSSLTAKLTENSVAFKLDDGGATIAVDQDDLARARVLLAAGSTANAGRPGYELFDGAQWGETDFTQKVKLQRALEGELERTIGKMQNVASVKVHLALESEALFKDRERPSKASVTLAMQGGQVPTPETVRGIAGLVASSVGGLEPSHVTIVDARGQALTMEDEGSVAGLTSRQLAVQREVELYMQKKAGDLLTSLVGSGNARVQVAAAINFDKVERTTLAVDPDKQAVLSESKDEITPGAPEQGAAQSRTQTTYENTRSTENFSGAIGNVQKLTVAVLVADKVTMPAVDTTQPNAAAPAPIVTPRTPEELARIEALVRNALGVDSTRGDFITVQSAAFDFSPPVASLAAGAVPADTTAVAQSMLDKVMANPKPVVALAALVVLLIVAIVSVLALRPKKKAQDMAALPARPGYPELPASAPMQAALQAGYDGSEDPEAAQAYALEEQRKPVILPPPPTTPEREQAIATVEQRPDAAVRVVRNWLRQ